jgi:hypothetical protein
MLSMFLNVAALVISLLALAVSTYLTRRQSIAAKQANQIPVFVDLYREARTPDFYSRERSLWENLSGHDPAKGLSGLSAELRHNAEVVYSYYSNMAYCISIGVVERDLAIMPIHYRMLKTWDAMYPFVIAERKIRDDGGSFLTMFEHFASEARRTDIHSLERAIIRKTFPRAHVVREGPDLQDFTIEGS